MDTEILVPLSQRQYQMILDAEQEVSRAITARNVVMNVLAAGVDFEGERKISEVRQTDGKWFMVLVEKPKEE